MTQFHPWVRKSKLRREVDKLSGKQDAMSMPQTGVNIVSSEKSRTIRGGK